MAVLDELRELAVKQLRLGADIKITLESSFVEDLGADSLDMVELVMALEEKFHIEIPDEDAEMLVTVKDALDYLKEKGIEVD